MDKHLGDDDKAARFEQLAMPHLDAAYNLARWLTRDPHDADDLVQSAYLRAYRFADNYRGGDARAWLLTIVRNTFYTALRDRKPQQGDVSFDEALHGMEGDELLAQETANNPACDPAAIVASRDMSRGVDQALRQLPPAFREVLVLKEMDELSYKQIAEVADIPIGTVMSRLARARKLLLSYLQRDMAGE